MTDKPKKKGVEFTPAEWNEIWSDRIRLEQQAAKEWQGLISKKTNETSMFKKPQMLNLHWQFNLTEKWGCEDENEIESRKQRLLETTIPSAFHDLLKNSKENKFIQKNIDGTSKETVDQTFARRAIPTTYNLIGY